MEMTGEQRIEAPRDQVWAALNDPEVLKRCIPGCQSLEKTAEDRMRAVAAIKVGPIGARFTGEVTLSELDPPNGYRIEGEGQGGPAGFAKGGAKVRLTDHGAATLLAYEVSAQVGGKLAQLGGPMIDATAKQMAGAFFRRLSDEFKIEQPAAAAPATGGAAPLSTPAVSESGANVSAPASGLPVAWVLAVVVAALAGFLLGRGGAESGASAWMGLSIGLLVIIVAAASFSFGRRDGGASAPVVVVDAALLSRLTNATRDPDA